MASASSSSAKSLFADSRVKLVDRVGANVESAGSLCRQVARGSRSQEVLGGAARAFAAQESAIDRTSGNVQKLRILATHLGFQLESVTRSARQVPALKEHVQSIQP